MPHASDDAIDLMNKLLSYNPIQVILIFYCNNFLIIASISKLSIIASIFLMQHTDY